MLKKLNFLRFLVLLLLPAIIYSQSLNYYFSQDDFIHLYSSKAETLGQFLNFFNPNAQFPDIFFYRPLGTQVYFFINESLFRLNPLPFRVEILLFQSLNILLFYFLVKNLWNNSKIAFLSALFYGMSAVHFLSIFYISAFQEVLRMTFIFSALLLFIKYLKSHKINWYIGSNILFIGGLLSKETSVVFPMIILGTTYLFNKSIKDSIIKAIPFWLITASYFVIRLVGFQQIFGKGEYTYSLNLINLIQNLKWYLIWSFGIPEILSTYPSLKPVSLIQFTKDFPLGLSLVIFLFLFLITLFFLIIKVRKFPRNMFLYGVFVFFISLSPVLILIGHKYPQYLDLAMLGYLPILSFYIVSGFKWKYIVIVCIFSFLLVQIFSLRITEKSHWTTHRSNVAKFYFDQFKGKKIDLDDSKLILVGSEIQTKEVSVALAKSYAFWIWYPNYSSEIKYLSPQNLGKSQPNEIMGELTIH